MPLFARLARTLITRRRLLEWTPSSHRGHGALAALAGEFARMWMGPTAAIAVAVYLWWARPAGFAATAPLLALWLASPAIAWQISRPLEPHEARLSGDQLRFLRALSRRTWGFFETYVGPEDHFLPPDNHQESPVSAVAHRTSPTNIGLTLLANLSAYDFGYITAGRLIERTAYAFQAMAAMPRHRGHFYNWYDSRSLSPLSPLYISSVDSGNLAGHLLTLRPGLLALLNDPILPAQAFDGLRDTLALVVETTNGAPAPGVSRLQSALDAASRSRPATVADGRLVLERLAALSATVAKGLDPATERQASRWARVLVQQCQDLLDDLASLAPWTSLPASATAHPPPPAFASIPTLGDIAALDGEWSRPAKTRVAALRQLAQRVGRFRGDGVGLPVRPDTPPARDRVQRHRASSGLQLLRSARLGGAPLHVRGDCPGTPAAGELVCAGTPARRPRPENRCCCRGAGRCSST